MALCRDVLGVVAGFLPLYVATRMRAVGREWCAAVPPPAPRAPSLSALFGHLCDSPLCDGDTLRWMFARYALDARRHPRLSPVEVLCQAARSGRAEIVALPGLRGCIGPWPGPFAAAAENGHISILDFFLRIRGRRGGERAGLALALYRAAQGGHAGCVYLCLQHDPGCYRNGAIAAARRAGHIGAVALLKGAWPEPRAKGGGPPPSLVKEAREVEARWGRRGAADRTRPAAGNGAGRACGPGRRGRRGVAARAVVSD